MNKILIAVIIAALVGLGFYFYNNSRSDGNDGSTGTTEESGTQGPTSLKSLLGLGKNQQCTFSSEGSSGTVYIAGDRMRTDITTSSEGVDTSMSMISDGEWMYYWGSAMPQGIKMKLDLDAANEFSADSEGEINQSLDVNQEFDYDCGSWRVDGSKFELPAGVEFLDLSAQLEIDTPSMCSYCESMSGEDKEACLVAYSC